MFRRISPLLAAALLTPYAAPAQTLPDLDKRVTRLEKQVGHIERKVLPKGERELIEPEISGPEAAAAPPAPPPASAQTVSDLAERVGAVERRQREITAQIEEESNRLRQIEDRFDKLRLDHEARLARLEAVAPSAAAVPAPGSAPAVVPADAPTPPPQAAAAPPKRPAAPPSADAEYKAAMALIDQKQWTEAAAAFQGFAADHPADRRVSSARYWAGRALYNQGQFERAARAQFDNYKADPKGERAQESLFWVGASLVRLKKTKEACQVYDLAKKVYADQLKPELGPQFAAARVRAHCDS